MNTWMLDVLRLVSTEDVGRDEANVQSLLRKHKDVTDELNNYAATIDALKQQAQELGDDDRNSPEVKLFTFVQYMMSPKLMALFRNAWYLHYRCLNV